MANQLKYRRYLSTAVVVALIGGLVTSFVYLRRYSPYRVSGLVAGNPEIVLSLRDIEMVGRSGGEKLWSFHADRADVARGQVSTTFYSIRDGSLYDEGKVVASVKAGKATYNSGTDDVEVTGGVEIASPRGYRAEAERARWSSYFKRLWCPGRVIFSAGDSEIIGYDLTADMRNQEVSFVRGKMVVAVSDMQELGEGNAKPDKGEAQ